MSVVTLALPAGFQSAHPVKGAMGGHAQTNTKDLFDSQGGIGKMHQLFGDKMNEIIDELNEELVA
ncbi:MAG: hypothetical protein ACI9FG_000681 [Crocinitomicaceae bacterium]